MVKKRTGLQCKISSIFSQVPVPKKDEQSLTSSTSQPLHQEPNSSNSTPSKQKTPTVTYKQPTEFRQRTTSIQVINTKIPKKPTHELTRIAWLRKSKNFGIVKSLNPKRQRIGMVLLFTLSCLFVVVLIRNFKAYRPTSFDLVKQPISQALVQPNIEIKWPIPLEYPSNLPDPMEPKAIERPDLIVRGIVTIKDRLFAIIGRELVGQGEAVNGVNVIKIDPNTVQFELDGNKWVKAKTSDLIVKGIVLGEGHPKVLIGIQVIGEGRTIYGVTVVKISMNSVEFEMDGRRWKQKVEGDKKAN